MYLLIHTHTHKLMNSHTHTKAHTTHTCTCIQHLRLYKALSFLADSSSSEVDGHRELRKLSIQYSVRCVSTIQCVASTAVPGWVYIDVNRIVLKMLPASWCMHAVHPCCYIYKSMQDFVNRAFNWSAFIDTVLSFNT